MTPEEKIKNEIRKQIIEKEDSFWNHFKASYYQYESQFQGCFTKDGFKIWYVTNPWTDVFSTVFTGIFHPVITGVFSTVDNKLKITLSSKQNIVGFLLTLFFTTAFCIIGFFAIKDNDSMSVFLQYRIVPWILFTSVFFLIPYYPYRVLRKIYLKAVEEMINEALKKD